MSLELKTNLRLHSEVAQELRVRVGYHRMDRLGGTEKTFTVEKIIDHEDYDNMMLDHDVSLLKLTESITYVQHI